MITNKVIKDGVKRVAEENPSLFFYTMRGIIYKLEESEELGIIYKAKNECDITEKIHIRLLPAV